MVENDEIISDGSKVANSFSNVFENALHTLGIKTSEYSNDNYGLKNPVEIAIKNTSSIWVSVLLKKMLETMKAFNENILKEIIILNKKKEMKLLKTFLLAASRMYQIFVALF